MGYQFDKDDILWVIAAFEPATPTDIADPLPITPHAVRSHLRALDQLGQAVADDSSTPYEWRVTDAGGA